MNLSNLLSNTLNLFAGGGKSAFGNSKIGHTDMGVLKVAMMVAAMDGTIRDEEYATFERLARQCRGYSEEAAAKALDAALRSAGYLLLKSQRCDENELVGVFLEEASAALPAGFTCYSAEDMRRAVVMWMAMGMGDGEFAPVERACVTALRRRLSMELNASIAAISASWIQPFPADGADSALQRIDFISDEFASAAESLLSRLAGDDAGRAEQELDDLIRNCGK